MNFSAEDIAFIKVMKKNIGRLNISGQTFCSDENKSFLKKLCVEIFRKIKDLKDLLSDGVNLLKDFMDIFGDELKKIFDNTKNDIDINCFAKTFMELEQLTLEDAFSCTDLSINPNIQTDGFWHKEKDIDIKKY